MHIHIYTYTYILTLCYGLALEDDPSFLFSAYVGVPHHRFFLNASLEDVPCTCLFFSACVGGPHPTLHFWRPSKETKNAKMKHTQRGQQSTTTATARQARHAADATSAFQSCRSHVKTACLKEEKNANAIQEVDTHAINILQH